MPVALRAGSAFEVEDSASSWKRSSPFAFLTAALEFLGAARASFSSAARSAPFSAFLRAASAFFASASSLRGVKAHLMPGQSTYFFAFDFAPLDHSVSSAATFFALSAAAFWFATSTFCILMSVILPTRDSAKVLLRCLQLSWCSPLFHLLPW